MSDNKNLPQQRKTGAVSTVKVASKKKTKYEVLLNILKLIKRFFAQFGTAIIAASIVAYMFLQLVLNVGAILNTEVAVYVDMTEKKELTAYVFRNEYPIPSSADGTHCHLAKDGEKVRAGEQVAITYSNPEDVKIQNRISEIDARIEVLQKSSLSTGASTTNITMLDTQINELVLKIIRQADSNQFDKVLREKEELLILMNRRQAIIQAENYEAELNSLKHEKQNLENSLGGASFVTYSPQSGYYYSNVDGYEKSFTIDRLQKLTTDEFEKLSETPRDDELIKNSSGKIIVGSTWYIAVAVDKRTAEGYTDGYSYPITFQYSNNTVIDMTIERRMTRTDKDMTVLILSTKVMPQGFDYSRSQTVELPCKEHKGLRISSSALRVKDGKTGVYVVVGSKVVFKEATVTYTYGSYSVCEIPKDPYYPDEKDISYSSKKQLSLHDTVIIDGNDIYDGMRLT